MKKVQSHMMVLSKGSVWGSAYDIDTLNEILTSLAKEHGEGVMKGARIVNVLHETYADAFPLEKVEGEVYFNESTFGMDKYTYILNDYNNEFSEEEELQEWIKEQIKLGELTIDEAKSLDITLQQHNDMEVAIEQDEDEWRLKVEDFEPKHTELMDAMAIEYVPAHAHEKELQEVKRTVQHDPEAMSDEEISFEINALEVRMQKLMSEQRRRKVAGYLHIEA